MVRSGIVSHLNGSRCNSFAQEWCRSVVLAIIITARCRRGRRRHLRRRIIGRLGRLGRRHGPDDLRCHRPSVVIVVIVVIVVVVVVVVVVVIVIVIVVVVVVVVVSSSSSSLSLSSTWSSWRSAGSGG
jgi:hypothetical protein